MGYAMFMSSLAVYIYQRRELNLLFTEKSVEIAYKLADQYKIDIAAIKQCIIH